MRIAPNYTSIAICPKTNLQLTVAESSFSQRHCPRCGELYNSAVPHHTIKSGKRVTPSFFEWVMGSRSYFKRQEDE